MRHINLHNLPIESEADVARQVRGKRIAVSTTLLHGYPLDAVQRYTAEFFRNHPNTGLAGP